MTIPPYVIENAIRFGLIFLGEIAVFVVGIVLLRVMRNEFVAFFQQKGYADAAVRMSNLATQWMGWVVILLVMLRLAGVQVVHFGNVFTGVGLVLGIAVAAGWSVVRSFISGMSMLASQPFRLGDDIELIEPSGAPGVFGRVAEFNYLYTTLQQTDAESGAVFEVRVPNSEFHRKACRRTAGSETSPLRVFPSKPAKS